MLEEGFIEKSRYEYDEASNLTATIRHIFGKESREECKYDSFGRLIEKKDSLGSTETWEYDPKINQKTHTDPMGLKTIETYNVFGQLSSLEKRKVGQLLFGMFLGMSAEKRVFMILWGA